MKVMISRNELAAALLFASLDDSRYALTGIQIETGISKPTIIATDGRKLAVIETQAEQPKESFSQVNALLKPSVAKLLIHMSKAVGDKLFPWILLESEDMKSLRATFEGTSSYLWMNSGAFFETEFPEWRKCVPSKTTHRKGITDLGINANLMSDFAKAAKILGSETGIIQMNLVGTEKLLEIAIPGVENFYGLLAQTKLNTEIDYQPSFVFMNDFKPVEQEKEELNDA